MLFVVLTGAAIVVASALALIPRDVRTMRSGDAAIRRATEEAEAEVEVEAVPV